MAKHAGAVTIYILYKVKLKQLLVPDPGSTLGRPGVLGLG